jgi:hypothetical protein
MVTPFDPEAIRRHGWRQGAVLGPDLVVRVAAFAPGSVKVASTDWLIVTSHDCDVVSPDLGKEPVVEVLRAQVSRGTKADRQRLSGRNPRALQLKVEIGGELLLLTCNVHDRWIIPRELLAEPVPLAQLADRDRRLIAEWLAKRYLRAAFPTAFDLRWRGKLRDWQHLLRDHSEWIQGVYLRLDTLAEIPPDQAYQCHLLLAVPHDRCAGASWPPQRAHLAQRFQAFWNQFAPAIHCVGVEPLGTHELTLADIEPYQRFDADWVSFEDDTPTVPTSADLAR